MGRGTEALSLVVAGHVSGGWGSDLKDGGETLDTGEATLVVAAASDMAGKVQAAMSQAEKVESKPVRVDVSEMEKDFKDAQKEATSSGLLA
jgi:hypothetical protein